MEAITRWCHVAPGGKECKPTGVVSYDEASAVCEGLCGLEVPGVPESSELQMKLTSPLTFQQIILSLLTDPIPSGCSSRNCAAFVKILLNPCFVARGSSSPPPAKL